MKHYLLFLLSIASFQFVWAQQSPSAITAKLTLGEVTQINDMNGQEKDEHRFILVSFINHSNKKLYIPDIKNMLLVSKPYNAIFINKNDTQTYAYPDAMRYHLWQEMHPKGGLSVGSAITGIVSPYELFQKAQTKVYYNASQIAKHYTEDKREEQYDHISLLNDCLYLKPQEEAENVFIIKGNWVFRTPGKYKIYYKPLLDSSRAKNYPDRVGGYKKLIPQEISSNILYFETKVENKNI